MDNSSLNATEIAVGSLLSGNRGIGNSGGAWGGGYGGVAPFAGPASNAVRVDRNNDRIKDCCDTMQLSLDQAEDSRRSETIIQRVNDAELRNADRLRDVEREIASNSRVAAESFCDVQKEILKSQALNDKCCCETQKEILRLDANNSLRFAELSKQQAVDNGSVQAGLAAISAKTDANQKFNELFAENQALKTQVACGCTTGCSNSCWDDPGCPGQHRHRVTMCLRGKTIRVPRRAIKGILNAGGTCGPCEDVSALNEDVG